MNVSMQSPIIGTNKWMGAVKFATNGDFKTLLRTGSRVEKAVSMGFPSYKGENVS